MSQLFRLKNGTVLLSTEAPGGIYNSGQLKKIAELCSKELAIVKATEDQRLALFVKESEVNNVAQQLRAIGLGFRHYQDSLHQPVSCLGELCEEHEQPAMATAMEITKEVAAIQLNAPLKIGVNGCARCCTPCHTLDIAVVGDSSGYRISLGGKTKQMPEFASYFAEGVPPKELPKRLKAVIETFKNLAEDGETLHDVIERCGVSEFVQALAPYSQDAAHREDPFAAEAAAAELPEIESANEVEEDILAEDDGLSLEDADLSVADDQLNDSDANLGEIPIEHEDQGSLEDDLALQGLGDEPDDLEIDSGANIPEDDIDLDGDVLDVPADSGLDTSGDLELDESIAPEDAMTEDMDEASLLADAPADEDLEGIPELDEDLALDEAPAPAPVAAKAGPDLHADFDEELPGDMPELSDEEENQFEQKLHASIDEESRLIAKADKDPNIGDRQAALSFLEKNSGDKLELSADADDLGGDLEISEDMGASDDLGVAGDLEMSEDLVAVDELGGDLDAVDGLDDSGLNSDLELADDLGSSDLEVSEDLSGADLEASDDLGDADLEVSEDLNADLEVSDDLSSADLEVSEDLNADLEVSDDLSSADLEVSEDLGDADLEVSDDLSGADLEVSEDLGEADLEVSEDLSGADLEVSEDLGGADLDVSEDLITNDELEDLGDADLEVAEDLGSTDLDASEDLITNDELELSEDDLGEDLEVAEPVVSNKLEEDLSASEDLASDDDLEVIDEELEPINESMEEFPEPGPRDLAHIKSRQLGQKLQGSPNRQQFKLSAISFQDEHMRVTFESGAYVDFDLSALGLGEERSFRLGLQSVSVTATSEGYILEVDGMRLFHPKTSLPAAS